MEIFHIFKVDIFGGLLLAGAVYFVYAVYWELTTGARRRRLIAERGALPPNEEVTDFFGWGRYKMQKEYFKAHKVLEMGVQRFALQGNTWKTRILGRSFIMTIEPANLKAIQSLDFKNWSLGTGRITAFSRFLGAGIFTTDGAAWQHSRDLLRPNFHRKQVGDQQTFESHCNHLLDAIPLDGSAVDLQDLFFRLTMDSATEFLFGESTGTLKPGLGTVSHTAFADAFMRAQDIVGDWARFNNIIPILPRYRQLRRDTKFVHDFVDGYVEKGLQYRASLGSEKARSAEGEGRYVFLYELVKQTDDKKQIRSELLNILLAGRDTTASLLSNMWHVLARRPDIFAKLRSEIIETIGSDGRPSFEQIKELKYLRACLNESLRLYPVVPGNSREATSDTVLPLGGGPDGKSPLFIPKGGVVGWSVYTMHRRKDFYGEDSHEFRPERWLGEKGLRPGWEYLPFNGGPRICIGQQFALTEASYTTIRLCQAFKKIEPRDDQPWTEWITLTLASFHGCKVALTPA